MQINRYHSFTPHSQPSASGRYAKWSALQSAFTLIELLVATAVVAVVLVLLLTLTTRTMEVTEASKAKMQSGGDLRSALDRMSVDFSSGIYRDDLSSYFGKQQGNDVFYFHASAAGYGGDRGISRIGYRIFDGRLERAAEGTGWVAAGLQFGAIPATQPIVDATNYDLMADRVFRMEVDFLMMDGKVQNAPAPVSWDEVRAIIVTLATIDDRAMQRFTGDADDLAALFPDPAANDARAIDRWSGQLMDPGLFPGGAPPPAVLQGLHVRQRIFPIRR